DPKAILERIRAQLATRSIFLTQHARQEMVDEAVTIDEILQAITTGRVLENYAEFYKGPCCLLSGQGLGRPLHIVCSTSRPELVIITVYEPKPPKWAILGPPRTARTERKLSYEVPHAKLPR
ncbi:MAG: DUF4258 domain-containing protein, partial [Deinococcota bacterium]|nr:DUF4258 domain-containing protein [Deinococcota bacterium]